MKDYIIKISLCASFLFLITNCGVSKKDTTIKDLKTDPVTTDTVVYKAPKTTEKKTFLKDSDK
jgi:hypothetical protein